MPATYVDQFWEIDPFAPPPVGTSLTVFDFTIVDQDDDNLVQRSGNDAIDGFDVTRSYPDDTVTVTLPGGGTVTITGITFYLSDGRQIFTPTDGAVLETSTFVSSTFVNTQGPLAVADLGPPCMVAGTLMETPDGPRPVETLCEGDRLTRYDDGRGLRIWKILHRRYHRRALRADPKLYPVRIMAGALGEGLPKRDLLVSRQHRILVRSAIAQRMFDTGEVLIAANKLTVLPGIFVDESVQEVAYFHILFDQHEVVIAEGAPIESLYTGPEAMKMLSPEAREEIYKIFPQVAKLDYEPAPARFIPIGKLQKKLIARHHKNARALLA